MSLSKYYKSSNSFQAEELIKREVQTPSGWQSSQQKQQLPFQTQQLPTAPAPAPKDEVQTSTAQPIAQPIALPTDNTIATDNTTVNTEPAVSVEKQPDATPFNQAIDLSNYLELAIAEEKIAE